VFGPQSGGEQQQIGGVVAIFASSYPFLEFLWSMLVFFAWVIFIWVAITVLIDVFRRHDLSGWAKAGWTVLVVLFPWLGVLIYLIVNHQGMADRRERESANAQAQFDDYVRQTAGSGGAATEIARGKALMDDGTITQAEFDSIKAKALAA
jgi:Phospholipase_D-nuclease N-terminal